MDEGRKEPGACAYPWQQLIVDLTGEVVPCCFWSGYGNRGKPLGNTNAQSLDQIWNGPEWRALRRANASGDVRGTPCHECLAWKWAGGAYPPFTLPVDFRREQGAAFLARLPDGFLRAMAAAGAPARLLEDGRELGPEDALHDDIRRQGGGRYSVWNEWLYFSSSDGSDPASNGRRYELLAGDVRHVLSALAPDSPSGANILQAQAEYERGAEVMTARPTMLSFISTADCNIDCPACSQNTVRRVGVQHRPATEPDVLAHVPGLHQFIWHGGEPWLIRGFRAFLDGFRTRDNPNLTFGFTSNGTLLDAEELAKLEKFPRVNGSISMDSFVKESFERIRAGARFETVLENVLRAVRWSDPPRRVISVGMIVLKSNVPELPFNLRFAIEHDIGLNLSPVLVYPVSERLDVFEDWEAQTRGWDAALAEAQQVVAEARVQGCLALRRVDPGGMLLALADVLRLARERYADCVPLAVTVEDPHGSLAHMRRPGLILARDDRNDRPLAYVRVPAPGRYVLRLPRADLGGSASLNYFMCHDLLEPMGVVAQGAVLDDLGRTLDAGRWRVMPRAMRLELPVFRPVPLLRNAALSRRGQPRPGGLEVLDPPQIWRAYLDLVQREAAAGKGLVCGDEGPWTALRARCMALEGDMFSDFAAPGAA